MLYDRGKKNMTQVYTIIKQLVTRSVNFSFLLGGLPLPKSQIPQKITQSTHKVKKYIKLTPQIWDPPNPRSLELTLGDAP